MRRSNAVALLVLSLLAPTGLQAQTGAPHSGAQRMRVDRLRAYLPHADGRGIRVGVVADSVNALPPSLGTLQQDQAAGDLPADGRLIIVSDGPSGSRDAGRAMLHHIFDIAPGVSALGFATATGGQSSMAAAIDSLSITHAMDVIVDGYAYADEPIYQDGVVATAVAGHAGRGIHISAAGDLGDSSVEQVWRDTDGDDLHEFNGSPLEAIPINASIAGGLTLFWSEPWGAAGRDFNIELMDSSGQVVAASQQNSQSTRLPYDSLTYSATQSPRFLRVRATAGGPSGVRFKVLKAPVAGSPTGNPFEEPSVEFTGSGAITPHAGALQAIAVGSASPFDPTVAVPYSSRGLHRRLFDAAGEANDQTFQKPDFVAPDSAQVPFGSFAGSVGFNSTAAAAANVAAVSAIVLQLKGGPDSLSQAELRQFLRTVSRANPPLSHSRTVGFGFVDALGAGLAAAGPQPITQMLIPNHLGDVDRQVEAVGPATLNVLRFARAGSDFVTTRIDSRDVPVTELTQGNYPQPMHLIFDESGSPFKAVAYATSEVDGATQATRYYSVSQTQPVTPLSQVVIASETSFASNQFMRVRIDGPSFPFQVISTEAEFNGSISPGAPVAFYQMNMPADGGPAFTVEVSSEDADIVLAAFTGLGDLIAESPGATLSGSVPPNDQGFYLAVTSRSYETFGNFTVRFSYQRVPGIPRGGVEFSNVSTDRIPNPVTGEVTLFGRLGVGLDTDTWALRTGGGLLTANVTGAFPSTALLGAGVYNDGQLLIQADGPSLLPGVSTQTEAGRLYIVAGGHGESQPATDYNVEVRMTPPTPTVLTLLPDRETGAFFRGVLDASLRGLGDAATFRFVNPPLNNGTVLVTIDSREVANPNFNVAFALFDSAGVIIDNLNDNEGPLGDEAYEYQLTPGAEYYVQVFGSPGLNGFVGDTTAFGAYTVDVRAFTSGIVPEPDEPNNVVAQAFNLTTAAGQWTESLFGAFILTDVDFFRVSLAAGENTLAIRSRGAGARRRAAAPAFNLTDGNGRVLAPSSADGEEQALTVSGLSAAGDYYIQVPGDNSGLGYGLLWTASSTAVAPESWTLY